MTCLVLQELRADNEELSSKVERLNSQCEMLEKRCSEVEQEKVKLRAEYEDAFKRFSIPLLPSPLGA